MEGKPMQREPDQDAVMAQDSSAPERSDAPASPEPVHPEKAEAPAPAAGEASPAPATESGSGSQLPAEEHERLMGEVIAALKTVYDPEIPADIYELGLIYDVAIDADRNVAVVMTLTAPACPVAGEMPGWVENAVNAVPGVAGTTVTMSFDPPWDMSRMSDEARLALNMF